MRFVEVKSEWIIRAGSWSDIKGFAGYLQTPKGVIPVRGEFEEFHRNSSLVDAGDRIIRHVDFRYSTGGKLIRANWIFRTCGYSVSHWEEAEGGDIMYGWSVSQYI